MRPDLVDPTFERLKWDPLLDCWLGGIDWPPGLHTEVAIWPPDGEQAPNFQRARDDLSWLVSGEERIRRSVARQALPMYNDAWRGNDAPLAADTFADRIELVRIGFEAEGSLLLSYLAGDRFGGHVLDAHFDPARQLGRTNLIG